MKDPECVSVCVCVTNHRNQAMCVSEGESDRKITPTLTYLGGARVYASEKVIASVYA